MLAHAIKQDEQNWQDRVGGSLQEQAYARPGTSLVFNSQFRRLSEALQWQPGMHILDVGCGVGLFLSWLQGQGATCQGVDLSPNSARLARKRGVHAQTADVEHLPFADATFDRICCNGAAHHFLDLPAALQEIRRVLKPHGRLVLYEPAATALTEALRKLVLTFDRYESPADLAHKQEFTPTSVCRAIEAAGFASVNASWHDWLAYPLSGMYMNWPPAHLPTLIKGLLKVEANVNVTWLGWRILITAQST